MSIYGVGILKGMWITLKNFMLSFIKPRKLGSGGMVTSQYPDEKLKHPEHFRYFPFLVYDEDPNKPRCTGCNICGQECPPKCMTIVRDKDENGKPITYPKIFDIDVSICMQCGICQEVCPFDAIYMDHVYEESTYERQRTLNYDLKKLLKPATYFAGIRPKDFAAGKPRKIT
jgi:NADH-quinone oxidoreductase subunit I